MEPQTHDHSATNWFLAFLTAMFTMIEQSTADEIYTWVFRVLTIISLALMIIINWKKAMSILLTKKKESNGNHTRPPNV